MAVNLSLSAIIDRRYEESLDVPMLMPGLTARLRWHGKTRRGPY